MAGWVSGKLRLLLEWVTLPLMLTAMQLPHGAVIYWLSSSSLALAQHLALRTDAVRTAAGLPARGQVSWLRARSVNLFLETWRKYLGTIVRNVLADYSRDTEWRWKVVTDCSPSR